MADARLSIDFPSVAERQVFIDTVIVPYFDALGQTLSTVSSTAPGITAILIPIPDCPTQ